VLFAALAVLCCVGLNAAETNIALNPAGSGYPSPLESNRGWGGGSYPWEIVDGLRTYPVWYHGLAFTGGDNNWAGDPCGPRQATINFGAHKTFHKVIIWHHGHDHAPANAQLAYWNGTIWVDIPFQRSFGAIEAGGAGSTSDEYTFTPVTGSKVRWSLNNCLNNVLGTQIIHGWIYEFEVFGTEGCQIDVPPLYQAGPGAPWASDPYANSPTETIGSKGCAMTCLCMALNKVGMTYNPKTLNRLLESGNGYLGLGVSWWTATKIAAEQAGLPAKFQFKEERHYSDAQFLTTQAEDYLTKVVCELEYPVIVGVNIGLLCDRSGACEFGPTHFVLVTGKEGDRFKIADPGFRKQHLDDYYDFETRGYVADPSDNISEITVGLAQVAEGVRFVLYDAAGSASGLPPRSTGVVEGIPKSVCFIDSLADDVSGAAPTEAAEFVHVFQPTNGVYRLEVTGELPKQFTLSLQGVAVDGSLLRPILIEGIAGAGSTSSFQIQFDSTHGAISTVARLATFASTLQDIENALSLQLIDGRGIANSFEAKVAAAQRAANGGQTNAARNILDALKSEIAAQSGKHISVVVSEILLQDTAALASGLTQ